MVTTRGDRGESLIKGAYVAHMQVGVRNDMLRLTDTRTPPGCVAAEADVGPSASSIQAPSTMPQPEIPHVLVHDPKDNVGVVVVEGLRAATDMLCVITATNASFRLTANADVPIGHKVALADLGPGDTAVKYGEDIGRIVAPVKKGDHVHVDVLKTKRW